MAKRKWKRLLAWGMSLSMAVTGLSTGQIGTADVQAASEDDAVFEDALTERDITLREKLPEKASNVATGTVVTIKGTGTHLLVKDNGTMRTELSSKWLAENEMGTGINLGNTMDAVYPVSGKKEATPQECEQAWGMPITTQAYIDKIHEYGINTLRIPVSWSNADNDDGTYTIDADYLGRMEEIVNYALNDGMYVIINDHWDNQWWGQFGACMKDSDGQKVADEETRAQAWQRYERYWTQIAERFQGYSDHLIFEGANEELGDRLNGAICKNGAAKGYAKPSDTTNDPELAGEDPLMITGNLSQDELYKMVNRINQKFVDIVRSTGGNNAYRHLLIPGYNTDINQTTDDRFRIPKDTDENGTDKLFVSVHYFLPWEFCGDGLTGTYTKSDQKVTQEYFAGLKEKISDQGYGIIIGECGVQNPSGVQASVTQWMHDTYMEAQNISAVPVLWDAGQYFDRTVPTMKYSDIAVFYNIINGAYGDTSMSQESGNIPKVPYVDETLWKTKGIHAYLFYQTNAWDYRDPYRPLSKLEKESKSYTYIQAAGKEVKAKNVAVTDVLLTGDGEYTVSIDGINLTEADRYHMLGISTDINCKTYKDLPVKVTKAAVEVDGKKVNDTTYDLPQKTDESYYAFMAINDWADSDESFPLKDMNDKNEMPMAEKSLKITFTITGLDQVLQDIADGAYIDPETDKRLDGKDPSVTEKPTQVPVSTPTAKPSEVPDETPEATSDVKPSPTPKATSSVKPSQTPEVTAGVKPSQTPKATSSVKPAQTPEVTTSVKPSQTPEATASVKPSQMPEVTTSVTPEQTPEVKPSAEPSQEPQPTSNVQAGPSATIAAPSPTQTPEAQEDADWDEDDDEVSVMYVTQKRDMSEEIGDDDEAIFYKSSDTDVASINSSGMMTAKSAGKVTITIRLDGGLTLKYNILIKIPKVTLSKTKIKLQRKAVSKALRIKKKIATDKIKSYAVSKKGIVKISKKGAIKGLKKGTVVITVKMQSGAKATCKVTVR